MNVTFCAGVLAILLAASGGDAPEASSQIRERASIQFTSGVDAFAAKNYQEAAQAFAGANALVSHPNTMINLALALEQLGDLSGAWWVLTRATERFSDEPGALKLAAKELRSLASRTFLVRLQAPTSARVCIDGIRIPEESPGIYRVALPPGEHSIQVGDVQLGVIGEAGTERVLGFERIQELLAPLERRYVTAMAGATGGLVALSTGLALGAFATPASSAARTRLGYSAVAVGAAATGTAIALAVRTHNPERRRRRARKRDEVDTCAAFIDPEVAGSPTGLEARHALSVETRHP